jgi:hypothetical protein
MHGPKLQLLGQSDTIVAQVQERVAAALASQRRGEAGRGR